MHISFVRYQNLMLRHPYSPHIILPPYYIITTHYPKKIKIPLKTQSYQPEKFKLKHINIFITMNKTRTSTYTWAGRAPTVHHQSSPFWWCDNDPPRVGVPFDRRNATSFVGIYWPMWFDKRGTNMARGGGCKGGGLGHLWSVANPTFDG